MIVKKRWIDYSSSFDPSDHCRPVTRRRRQAGCVAACRRQGGAALSRLAKLLGLAEFRSAGGQENMTVTGCNSCSLREHLFYAGIFLSMTFIVILCLVLVNNNNNNNSNNPSLSTADHQSGAQLAISATGEENLF